jgi:CxxC motif-containing protein (DUF1111 family)
MKRTALFLVMGIALITGLAAALDGARLAAQPLPIGQAFPYEQAFPYGQAFSTPSRKMEGADKVKFALGATLFQRAWIFSPSADDNEFPGLGPLYNRLSCIGCHVKNGRGAAPGDGEPLRSMLVRLSVEGQDAHGGPQPHPAYGGQFNPEGGPDVAGEGDVVLHYTTRVETLSDGEPVELRAPHLEFRGLAYGPIDAATKTSLRNAPPVAGLGLLAQVPEGALNEIVAQNGGRLNHVWDVDARKKALGRFGWKANQPSIAQQMANAFVEDMGITSRLFMTENCTPAQTACLARAAQERAPELNDEQFEAIAFYLANLAPPPRRGAQEPLSREGAEIFARIGCGRCHRETLPLADGGEIAPYTDLALHDMGDGLADNRPDFEAGPRDWRTPPLWGLGLAGAVGDSANFLHDGRARSFAEAILWHGGEAEAAANAFRALPKAQREALIAFLSSL